MNAWPPGPAEAVNTRSLCPSRNAQGAIPLFIEGWGEGARGALLCLGVSHTSVLRCIDSGDLHADQLDALNEWAGRAAANFGYPPGRAG